MPPLLLGNRPAWSEPIAWTNFSRLFNWIFSKFGNCRRKQRSPFPLVYWILLVKLTTLHPESEFTYFILCNVLLIYCTIVHLSLWIFPSIPIGTSFKIAKHTSHTPSRLGRLSFLPIPPVKAKLDSIAQWIQARVISLCYYYLGVIGDYPLL